MDIGTYLEKKYQKQINPFKRYFVTDSIHSIKFSNKYFSMKMYIINDLFQYFDIQHAEIFVQVLQDKTWSPNYRKNFILYQLNPLALACQLIHILKQVG